MYYAEALPSEAARQSARDDLGTDDLRELAPRSDSWWAETYQLRGVEVQIGHTTVADVEQRSLAEALDPVERHMPEADNTLVRRRPHSDAYLRPMLVHTCIGKFVASVTEGEAARLAYRAREEENQNRLRWVGTRRVPAAAARRSARVSPSGERRIVNRASSWGARYIFGRPKRYSASTSRSELSSRGSLMLSE
jgi:hypothetical protein